MMKILKNGWFTLKTTFNNKNLLEDEIIKLKSEIDELRRQLIDILSK